jgi:hypothetical protein
MDTIGTMRMMALRAAALALLADAGCVLTDDPHGDPEQTGETQLALSAIGGQISGPEAIARADYWYRLGTAIGPYTQAFCAIDGGPSCYRDAEGSHFYRRDCSGYVSMSLHLTSSYNTNGLRGSSLFVPVSPDQIQPGDIVLTTAASSTGECGGHTGLFEKWTAGRTEFKIYDFGATPPLHRTIHRSATSPYMFTEFCAGTARHYQGYHYTRLDGQTPIPVAGISSRVNMGDVNGDGMDDLVTVYNNGGALQVRTKFSTGGGTWSGAIQTFGDGFAAWNFATVSLFLGDVTGDGKADLVSLSDKAGALQVRTKISNGNGTWSGAIQTFGDGFVAWNPVRGPVRFGDVDGDGRKDLVSLFDDGGHLQIRTKLSAGNGTWTGAIQDFGDGYAAWDLMGGVFIGDVTGDGKDDIVGLHHDGAALQIRTKISNGDGTWTGASQDFGDGFGAWDINRATVVMGDVNGDGRDDIVNLRDNDGALQIRTKISTGDGTWSGAIQDFGDGSHAWNRANGAVLMADVNGDNRKDVLSLHNDDGALQIRTKISTGDGAWTGALQGFGDGFHAWNNDAVPILVGDGNGDGNDDVISLYNSGGALQIRIKLATGSVTWNSAAQTFGDGYMAWSLQ